MKSILLVLLGVILTVAMLFGLQSFWSFSAQRARDYAKETPTFDLKKHLSGNFTASGVIYDYTGRVNTRFEADIRGEFDSTGGKLYEDFVYSHGPKDRREWTITYENDGTFTGTAPDVIGKARGKQEGNALVMRYKLKLPERSGGHVLDVVDWMYLFENGTILNRSEMRKFGIKVAELFAVFSKEEQEVVNFRAQAAE